MYLEYIALENALKKQIQDCIDQEYLEKLIDTTTKTIIDNISTILEFLFTNYGYIDSITVADKTDEIKNMAFAITDPLTRLYKAVEDLAELATAAQETATQET